MPVWDGNTIVVAVSFFAGVAKWPALPVWDGDYSKFDLCLYLVGG